MGVKIIYSKLSKFDLKEIFEFIQRDSVFYAKREVVLIEQTITKLKSNAFIGTKTEKFDDELRRQLAYKII
jgi:toxin ParE1/3/4